MQTGRRDAFKMRKSLDCFFTMTPVLALAVLLTSVNGVKLLHVLICDDEIIAKALRSLENGSKAPHASVGEDTEVSAIFYNLQTLRF